VWSTYIPIEIPAGENMIEGEFFRFCSSKKHIEIERDENKQILIMPLAGLESDNQSVSISLQPGIWNNRVQKGKWFGSTAGFNFPMAR
jgi:Uma2 family endonuclease